MKKVTRVFALTLTALVFFVILFGGAYLIQPTPARAPSDGYETLKDEYISAIETFYKTGNLVIPKGARFSYDNETVIIKDKDSNVSLTCTFALDGTVPIYDWNNGNLEKSTYYALLVLAFAISFLFYYSLEQKAIKRKFRKLNKIKANSPDGDKRQKSIDCTACIYQRSCSCPDCRFVKECGECFHSSCVTNMEKRLENEESEESDSIFEAEDGEE